MKIIVFGATGTVGRKIVKQALEKKHQVTAFVRNPENLPFSVHQNLKIIKGDVRDLEDVQEAMHGHEAVLCTLGDGKVGKIRAEGTKNIVAAMNDLGLKRLICQSTIGAGDSFQNLNFVWRYIMFGFLLKRVLPDHNRQEQFVQHSTLDYTIVRPSALTDGAITGNYKIGFAKDLRNLSLKINRADVADFVLRQLTTSTYIKQSVCISN